MANTRLYAGDSSIIPTFHLRTLHLSSCRVQPVDWDVLAQASRDSLLHLVLDHFLRIPSSPLATFFPSLHYLRLASILRQHVTSDILPFLPLATHLTHLAIPSSQLATSLHFLCNSIIILQLWPSGSVTQVDDAYLHLLNAIGRFPLDRLERIIVPAEHLKKESMSTPLYEVIEAAKTRGAEVLPD
jgi:hypothetical protein